MPRDAHIPLFLWIATALLVHLVGGGGATQAAGWIEEQVELRRFAQGVRSYLRTSEPTLEVTLSEDSPLPEPEPAPEPDPAAPSNPDAAPAENEAEDAKDPAEKPEPQAPEPEPTATPPKQPDKPEPVKVVPEKAAPAQQELVVKKSIAVRQRVQDEKQPDNPDAEFLSEHNNRVREQTQARITSNDQDDPDPTPGSTASGIGDQPGNASETRIAHSEDRPGEEGRPPSSEPAAERPDTHQQPPNAGAPQATAPQHTASAQEGRASGVQTPPSQDVAKTSSPGTKGQQEQPTRSGAAELLASERADSVVALPQTATAQQKGQRSRRKRALPPLKVRGYDGLLGLGASGTTASGINLNLTPGLARDAIGLDQLARERLADGARRRSQHLGSWKSVGIERWRSAIENYVPSVKPGNQTALNSARSPFGTYLSVIHNRLHPIFADWFLSSLDSLPAQHPMNREGLSTNLEIVLEPTEGRIVRMGVTKTSGITAFDIAALDSVQRASPFGVPPTEIVSPDGNIYLHWEFHRDPRIACTTYNARPFMLRVQPKPAPTPEIPPAKEPPVDDAAEGERHGDLERGDAPRRSRLARAP
ncbi:MAG TPA: hypothetical protein VER33_18090 [Polyangiaceae bacterium]|nr:hypothetical protein [Polyangiaceae bacterium]